VIRGPDEGLLEPFAGLLGQSAGATRSFEFEAGDLAIAGEASLATPIRGTGRAVRTNRGLLVALRATAILAETCGRCLDPAALPLEVDLDEEVLPSIDLATGQPLDAALERDLVRLDGHHRLDLGPLLRDAVSLAEPIAVLCRPDCPGLCPTCGARLADEPDHQHDDDELDARLSALRGFTVDGAPETG